MRIPGVISLTTVLLLGASSVFFVGCNKDKPVGPVTDTQVTKPSIPPAQAPAVEAVEKGSDTPRIEKAEPEAIGQTVATAPKPEGTAHTNIFDKPEKPSKPNKPALDTKLDEAIMGKVMKEYYAICRTARAGATADPSKMADAVRTCSNSFIPTLARHGVAPAEWGRYAATHPEAVAQMSGAWSASSN